MKKKLLFMSLLLILMGGVQINLNAQSYCVPSYSTGCSFGDDLNDVELQGETITLSNLNSGCNGDYSDNTSMNAPDLIPGNQYTIRVGTSYSYPSSESVKVWIDYNESGVFESSEVVAEFNGLSSGLNSASFTVPSNVAGGTKRMRVRLNYTSSASGIDPCNSSSYGEAEDYNVDIGIGNSASISQAAGTPSCAVGSDLTASGTLGANETWYWQATAAGTDMTNDASNPWTIYANGTYYIRTYDSSYAIWSSADSIEVTNFPSEAAPTNLTALENPVCAPGTQLSVNAAPSGIVNYWQGTNPNGTDKTNNASTPYSVTQTGDYYVRAYNTTTECWSDPVGISVVVETRIPNDPAADTTMHNFCSSVTSAEIYANTTYTGPETSLDAASGGTYSCNGNGGGIMFNITNDQNVDITLTALDVLLSDDVNPTTKVYYKSGSYEGFEENEFGWTLLGEYSTNGAPNTIQYLDIDDLTLPAGETFGIYLNYEAKFSILSSTQTYSDGNLTLTSGSALCIPWAGVNELFAFNGKVYYLEPIPTDVIWYDAASGGNQVGTTNPFETIGSSVIPSVADGSYEFYASSYLNGCESSNRELVEVNINPVDVDIDPIDADCNTGDNGSFMISSTNCGVAPFTYSVDGGAYVSSIPSNLSTGNHTVTVKDYNGDESAEYTITIGGAAGPSDVMIDDFTNTDLTVSWTVNGSENSWNLEWGLAGFAPGTGNEIGSVTTTSNPYTITGLSGYTDYYVYVSADCGGATPGDWDLALATTDCDVMPAIEFCEDFELSSELFCWRSVDNNGDGQDWSIYVNNANSGNSAAGMETDVNAGNNNDYYILPKMTLTGNELLSYFYNTGGSPTNYQVVMSTQGRDPADFNTVLFEDTISNTTYTDTTIDLSAHTGDVYIAFYIPPGALDGSIILIDDVCIDVCVPVPGIDGEIDVCRLDDTLDLSTVITSQYSVGDWVFDLDQSLINGSELNVSILASGSHDIYYIKTTECTSDTTVATINVFNKSSAGIGGSLTSCKNQPTNLYAGLSGNVDFGGSWYGPNNNLIEGSRPNASNTAGQYVYTYIASNNVCPADTSTVTVTVLDTCDYLSIGDELLSDVSVYPNPSKDQLNIVNPSNVSLLKVEILDMNGRVVLVEDKALDNASETTLTIEHLEKGIYTLRVYNSKEQKTFKIVKQ